MTDCLAIEVNLYAYQTVSEQGYCPRPVLDYSICSVNLSTDLLLISYTFLTSVLQFLLTAQLFHLIDDDGLKMDNDQIPTKGRYRRISTSVGLLQVAGLLHAWQILLFIELTFSFAVAMTLAMILT